MPQINVHRKYIKLIQQQNYYKIINKVKNKNISSQQFYQKQTKSINLIVNKINLQAITKTNKNNYKQKQKQLYKINQKEIKPQKKITNFRNYQLNEMNFRQEDFDLNLQQICKKDGLNIQINSQLIIKLINFENILQYKLQINFFLIEFKKNFKLIT
ncbi:hypothetical protein ABPG72_004990 [Tetrahymena utriculariae]